ASLNALSTSGRLRVTVATPSAMSTTIVSYVMHAPRRSGARPVTPAVLACERRPRYALSHDPRREHPGPVRDDPPAGPNERGALRRSRCGRRRSHAAVVRRRRARDDDGGAQPDGGGGGTGRSRGRVGAELVGVDRGGL